MKPEGPGCLEEGRRRGSREAAWGPKSAGRRLSTPGLLSWCRDAERRRTGCGVQEEGGSGTSLPRTVVPVSFPARSAPRAVPVQGPLGLRRPDSAVAMAMGEGGCWAGCAKVGFTV